MPVSAAVEWDLRPATGATTNGGGFKNGATGTDFSQQAAPQYALTGLTSAGSGNVILSAAAAADMVGNIAQAISGTNIQTGFYEVLSVSVGVSITFSTNAASQGICTGIAASGVINIGGALTLLTTVYAQSVADNITWLKGTLTITAVMNLFGAPTFLDLRGYTTTHGDGVKGTITTATNSTNIMQLASGADFAFTNITFTNTAGTRALGLLQTGGNVSNSLTLTNCVFDGFSSALDFVTGTGALYKLRAKDVEIKNCTSSGAKMPGLRSAHSWQGCKIHSNGVDGITYSASGFGSVSSLASFRNCAFYDNTGRGVWNSQDGAGDASIMLDFYSCAFVNNGDDNIRDSGTGGNSPQHINLYNSVIILSGGWGVNVASVGTAFSYSGASNAFGSGGIANTSGDRRNQFPTFTGDISLTVNPFTDYANGDFTLNSTAGGGAACKAAGFQSSILG